MASQVAKRNVGRNIPTVTYVRSLCRQSDCSAVCQFDQSARDKKHMGDCKVSDEYLGTIVHKYESVREEVAHAVQNEIQILQELITSKSEQLQRCTVEGELQEAYARANDECSREREELRDKIKHLDDKVDHLNKEKDELKDEKEKAKEKADEAEKKFDELKDKFSSFEDEKSDLISKIEELKEEMNYKLENLKEELEEEREKVRIAEAKIHELESRSVVSQKDCGSSSSSSSDEA